MARIISTSLDPANPGRRANKLPRGGRHLSARLVMMGQQSGEFVLIPPVALRDGVCDRGMQRDPARPQLHRVADLLDQRMAERETRSMNRGAGLDQIEVAKTAEQLPRLTC
jgi:hypothetical protein